MMREVALELNFKLSLPYPNTHRTVKVMYLSVVYIPLINADSIALRSSYTCGCEQERLKTALTTPVQWGRIKEQS